MFAIARACEFLLSSGFLGPAVSFFCDSQAAIKSLVSTLVRSSLVAECISLLSSVASVSSEVVIQWVPGHSGVPGNEAADQLAGTGSSCTPVGPAPFVPFSMGFLKAQIKEWMGMRQQEAVGASGSSKKSLVPTQALLDNGFSPVAFKHKDMWVLSQVFSGHSALHYFQHIIGHVGSAICPACDESVETSEHFLCSCIAFSSLRHLVFGASPVSLEFVLYHCTVAQVIRFSHLSGRFDRGKFTGRPPR